MNATFWEENRGVWLKLGTSICGLFIFHITYLYGVTTVDYSAYITLNSMV